MRLKLPNGELATPDTENAFVMEPHFAKIYQNHYPVDFLVLCDLLQKTMILELNAPISWKELKKSGTKLSNDKSPGLNEVPPDVFKALGDQNLLTLLNFSNSYWMVENDFSE